MSPTFRALEVRNYRLYASGAFISNIGTWMGAVAQNWLVLTELTDYSSQALGLVVGLQFTPFLLLAPFTGMIADRFPKRRILLATQGFMATLMLVTSLLVFTDTMQLWMMFVLAGLLGATMAIDNPARQTIVSEMVPKDTLANAVALNSASFNAGRLIGPGVAGLTIAQWGTATAFLINSVSFLATITALSLLRPGEMRPTPLSRGRGAIRDGFAYVKGRRDIQLVMLLVFVFGTFGMNFQITTALMATTVFDKGPTEFGILGSVIAIGSLTGALMSARRGTARLRTLLLALVGFTAAGTAAALAPSYLTFAVTLVAVGYTSLTALTTANAMVQTRVDPLVRGRVMALYMAIFMGGTPAGAPVIGWIGDTFGARWTIAIGPIAVAATLMVVAAYLARSENVRVSFETRRRPRLLISSEPIRPQVSEPVPQAAR
ncbi:MFS transporter [Nostocoides sp. F2B08]|uniref:MFS transporter n=1 Tax=Nostocoides sp. F2B08 TaxID=2653936 RepID=UPI001262C437|nr:MFS transporter [Tetrasphaera sp. F2B08]KAB7741390.1 MFS transporter [Tetrasphaera sp. F2B08]